MTNDSSTTKELYFGDNLEVLDEYINDESVDLIYLDPPFQSGVDYNVLFERQDGSDDPVQIQAFEDTWHWNWKAEQRYKEAVEQGGDVSRALQGLREFLGESDMLAYLSMMAPRLKQLRRVLKEDGSIYLHCDPTASHYLKVLMDAVFGPGQFQNEVIWYYRGGGVSPRRWGRKHDVILFYTKGDEWTFNVDPVRQPYSDATSERLEYEARAFRGDDVYEGYTQHPDGKHPDNVLQIQPIMPSARERLGYPTQKPEELLAQFILASSDEGDVVLDPFCGCGTTIAVAEETNRDWIGIDITHLAVNLIKHRLQDKYGNEIHDEYEVLGEPRDVEGARELAEQDRHQFEFWALGLVGARPEDEQRGPDRGIDGALYFYDDNSDEAKTIILSVKSGDTGPRHVRDLRGTVNREEAEIGVLITLEEPTDDMISEAASAGFYESPLGSNHPKIQVLTIEELLEGADIDYPAAAEAATYRQAPRVQEVNQQILRELDEGE